MDNKKIKNNKKKDNKRVSKKQKNRVSKKKDKLITNMAKKGSKKMLGDIRLKNNI
jgi:hypothetical protein